MDENQRNTEANIQLKQQIENQRATYTQLLTMTEKRVIQANMQISQVYADSGQDQKKQAAEYLTAQIYQLYEERRNLATENDLLKEKNADLQRLVVSQRIELDRYTAYVR